MSIINGPRAKAVYFNEFGKQNMSLSKVSLSPTKILGSPLGALLKNESPLFLAKPAIALKTLTSNNEPNSENSNEDFVLKPEEKIG